MKDAISLLESKREKTPVILQTEASECGLAAIAMIAGHHGLEVDMSILRRRFSVSLKGATLKHLMSIFRKLNFTTRALRAEVNHLDQVELPAILHWNMNHFVVLARLKRRLPGIKYHIHDPATGARIISQEELSRSWTGVVLEIQKSPDFVRRSEVERLEIWQLWSSMRGFWSTARQTFLLSLVLQFCALASPFYLQLAIDTAYPAFDRSLLEVLALGFAGIALIGFVTSWLRALSVATLTNLLSYQVTSNIFRHMMRLPLGWFERRHVGDIVSRFNSTQPVSQILSSGFVTSIIDGLMAVLTLVIMVIYSTRMSLIAILSLLSYAFIRFFFVKALRDRNIDLVNTQAAEQTAMIEAIRGFAAVKAFGQGDNRHQHWQERKAKAVSASLRLARLGAGFDATAELIVKLERVAFVLIAVTLAMNGSMTVGMIFAFQAYKQQFMDAGIRLVGQLLNYQIVKMHIGRISDIALTKPERSSGERLLGGRFAPMRLELQGVSYRFGVEEDDIFSDVTLNVEPGETVVLIGPSGGGKTTLLKIMMGLLEPTAGAVLVNGQRLDRVDLAEFRSAIGSVAQDDTLYAGTIAENIAFFDPDADSEWVRSVAAVAQVAEDIDRLPLKYDTLVGDMGSALSGGQRQRILLARALYGRPAVLFMDEGTANLDGDSEARVLQAIARLPITCVFVAHRSQAIETANRAYVVSESQVKPAPLRESVASSASR